MNKYTATNIEFSRPVACEGPRMTFGAYGIEMCMADGKLILTPLNAFLGPVQNHTIAIPFTELQEFAAEISAAAGGKFVTGEVMAEVERYLAAKNEIFSPVE
jgi:hypothetical protein